MSPNVLFFAMSPPIYHRGCNVPLSRPKISKILYIILLKKKKKKKKKKRNKNKKKKKKKIKKKLKK
jgi:hypothetical protein